LLGNISLFNPHPKSLSLRERDLESGSLLSEGEGLGMRAVNLLKKKWDAPKLLFGEHLRLKSWLMLQSPPKSVLKDSVRIGGLCNPFV